MLVFLCGVFAGCVVVVVFGVGLKGENRLSEGKCFVRIG